MICFVRGGVTRRLQVVTTPGIHTILFHGDRVASIPADEIESIRKAVNSSLRVEPHPFLRCGETVRVARGSLEGVRGVLIRKKSLYRLVLSVEMLAQSVAVEVDAADVEPVRGKDHGALSLKGDGAEVTANQLNAARGWSRRTIGYQRSGQILA